MLAKSTGEKLQFEASVGSSFHRNRSWLKAALLFTTVNAEEAAKVRLIFERYLALGSVHKLQLELEKDGVFSKRHVTAAGRSMGGLPFSRGALFHLLSNRLYRGLIVHKGVAHPGTHAAIIDEAAFEAAQALMASNRRRHRETTGGKVAGALFSGRTVDAAGEPMTPTFSYGRGGRVYRYYVAAALQQGGRRKTNDTVRRIPAVAIEALVEARLAAALPSLAEPISQIRQLRVLPDRIELVLPLSLRPRLLTKLPEGMSAEAAEDAVIIVAPVRFPLRGGTRSIAAGQTDSDPDETLIGALRKAHAMLGRDQDGHPSIATAPDSPYERRILRLAFLAPDIQRDILAGRQPAHLNLEHLMKREIPLAWDRQRQALGWSR